MKYIKFIILVLFTTVVTVSCEEDGFLDTPPIDQLTDETYWSSENNVRTFSYGFYSAFFNGYGSGFTFGNYFTGQSLNDDFAPTNPPNFTQQVPNSGGGWSFAWVRKANIFIDRIQTVPMEEEAIAHWTGVGRFFRAMEYAYLVGRFGDVPYYDQELPDDDNELLYKPRDSREFVMDQVLADFQYASANVRLTDGDEGNEVNRYVVLAYMSRIFLFEGTWQKYHNNNNAKAMEYLQAAKQAANEVMQSGEYSLGDYRTVFNSLSLGGNPEVLLYREYAEGVLTHSLNSYVNQEPQTGASMNAIESYLATDGLPIALSPLYQGDKGIENVMANRDGRMYETFVRDELRINGIAFNFSTTAYAVHKFLNEAIADEPIGSSNLNPTDAPVIRYGEVLVNYAEAAAELAILNGNAISQSDLDLSINVLRNRMDVNLPDLQVMNGNPAVNGMEYDDPDRDTTVPSMLWEIRRERRTELMMEGFRLDDLKRWKKLNYIDMFDHADINRGAWVVKADYPDEDLSNLRLTEGDQGYIIPAFVEDSWRSFTDDKVYLDPLPLSQITLYADQGVDLEQNPGW